MRIVITTTLNDNLFHAKLVPLLRSRPDLEVVVVSDRQGPAYPGVRWVWPELLAKILGRVGGRLPLLIREIFHPRTRLVMAYNMIPHGLFAVALGGLRGVPVFVHFIGGPAELEFAHNIDVSDNRVIAKSRNPKKLEKIADRYARRAAKIFVPGSNTEQFLKDRGFPAEQIVKLHSTIDPDRFFDDGSKRDFDIVVSAQLRERKRPLFTLDVFRAILNQRPETRFIWLGTGIMHSEFAQALKDRGLESAVTWHWDDDVAPYYRRAKVFLLCSINEGLSLAVMEAMLSGVVPIASDCGDMADVVGEKGVGTLIPMDAPQESYVQATLSLLNDPNRLKTESAKAIQIIAREHSFSAASRAWKDILATL